MEDDFEISPIELPPGCHFLADLLPYLPPLNIPADMLEPGGSTYEQDLPIVELIKKRIEQHYFLSMR